MILFKCLGLILSACSSAFDRKGGGLREGRRGVGRGERGGGKRRKERKIKKKEKGEKEVEMEGEKKRGRKGGEK